MRLPFRAYINNSFILTLTLLPVVRFEDNLPKVSLERSSDKLAILVYWEGDNTYLEVQLVGVGIEVKSLEPGSQTGNSLFYSWGCFFPNSGIQTLYIRMKLCHGQGDITQRLSHKVKVVQFDHMTINQIRFIAGVVGFVGTVLGICVALKKLEIL